jgi:putative spermidine/putrescine transport system ATP-binding protein
MKGGRIMQLDTPEVLYSKPSNSFVANFVGFDNMVEMEVVSDNGDMVRAQMAGGSLIDLPKSQFTVPSKKFLFAARPEGLSVMAGETAVGIPATLGMRTYIGRAYQYHCETAAGTLLANGPQATPLSLGQAAMLVPQPEQCCLLPIEA